MTRRSLLLTVIGVPMTAKTVTAEGFGVTGMLSATEAERLEGYAQIGNELTVSVHPKSPAYPLLMGMIGTTVNLHIRPS